MIFIIVTDDKEATMKKTLAALLTALFLLSCGFSSASFAEPADMSDVWQLVSEAYIYAFPLVLTDATKTLSTNTDGTMTGRAPINQFNHAKSWRTPLSAPS